MKNQMFISLLPIYTERLIIRPSTVLDVNLLLKMDKQEETQKYLGGIKNKTREERISFLQKKEDKFKCGMSSSLTVYLKDETPIGFIGLKIDESSNSGEISYIFDYDYCKRGYCIEAVKEIIDVGFHKLELKMIIADTIDGNIGSKRVLEKSGFLLIGKREKDGLEFLDYSINRVE